jgi:alginate O-acetyltransferase complex protein AlgI
MLFSSISFLYYFLPAVLALYFMAPRRMRNAILLLASLFFYTWGEPRFSIIMVSTAMTGYLAGLVINHFKQDSLRKLTLTAGIALSLIPLGLFKYGDFAIINLNRLFPVALAPLRLALPIGVSFYTFQILSYLVDVFRKDLEVERNPFDFLMYVAFFPQLIAGPIVRFRTISSELRNRKVDLELMASGIIRFVSGLGKKILIANTLAELVHHLQSAVTGSILSLWVQALAFTLQIYFDFSGYSDMAIGLGRMFGFQFLENFDYPYLSTSITEFWRRWHQSLGSWFRDYVYIPLGGSRGSTVKTYRNLLIVWLLTGLWHGASWNFVLWGLFYFLLLALERAGLGKLLKKLPKPLSVFYTFFFVQLGFVIFNAGDTGLAFANLSGMFGLAGLPLADHMAVYYTKSYLLTLIIALIAATPFPKQLLTRLGRRRTFQLSDWVTVGGIVLIMVFSTASLIDGSFNPFLYFRF